MKAICINSNLGGMPKGLQNAGFQIVMSIEESESKREVLDSNLGMKSIPAFPKMIDLIPRYDLLAAKYTNSWSRHDISFIIEKTKPRVLFFQFNPFVDLKGLQKKLSEINYDVWILRENISQWVPIDKYFKFVIALRNDVRQYFRKEFPLPEQRNFEESISINDKGYAPPLGDKTSTNVLGIEDAARLMGFPKGWNFGDIHPRQVTMEASPLVIQYMAEEIRDWGYNY